MVNKKDGENLKILFINPPWEFLETGKLIPLGLAYLISVLRKNGFNAEVKDFNVDLSNTTNIIEETVNFVAKGNYDVIGLSCTIVNFPFCIEFIKTYKKYYPKTRIILGGPYASLDPELLLNLCPVDIIVRGEGEETVLDLMHVFENSNNDANEINQIENIPGLVYKKEGKIYWTMERKPILNLDTLPLPAYDLFPSISKYQPFRKERFVFSIMASRGCNYRCIFCSSNKLWGRTRWRTVENVMKEISWLLETYNIAHLRFEDDDLLCNSRWIENMIKQIKDVGVEWICSARIDHVDIKNLSSLKEAGLIGIYHGIESGSSRVRKLLGKNLPRSFSNDIILNVIKKELKLGIMPIASFMIGTPFETKKDIMETFSMMTKIRKLGGFTQLWIMTPYPGATCVFEYKQSLRKVNRWELMRQSDVFYKSQRIGYGSLIETYEHFIPDNWIFRNDNISLKELVKFYQKGNLISNGEILFF